MYKGVFMLIKKVWICLSITLVCQFGFAQQSPSEAKTYGSNDVHEVVLKAAEEGNASAQAEIGHRYFNSTPPDYDNAVKWFRKAAEQGNARGQNNLGICYANGRGITKDEAEAVAWYRKAAEQGYVHGQLLLGVCYARGRGITRDESEAVRWLRKAAEQGNASGQHLLGFNFERGRGIAKDEAEAVKWYRKAAEQGHVNGQLSLGICYENGRGITKDEVEAVKWYRKAAEQGDAYGQLRLAFVYESGRGIAKDEAEAVKWYLKAAEKGSAPAHYFLGVSYELGKGVDKSKEEAIKWYQKAAEQGDPTGQEKCREFGVEWKVALADEIKNLDEKMLGQLKAKAESAKSSTVVFKNLYLGMPIQDAAALLRFYMSKGITGKAPKIVLENFSDGRWFREEKSGIRVTSSADGKVTAFYFPGKAVEQLFDSKDIDVKSFIQTFQDAYSLPSFLFESVKLEWFSKNNLLGMMQGIQPIASKLGFQEKWIATTDSGVSVAVYGTRTVFEEQKLSELVTEGTVETIPRGSLLIRKINKAAFD